MRLFIKLMHHHGVSFCFGALLVLIYNCVGLVISGLYDDYLSYIIYSAIGNTFFLLIALFSLFYYLFNRKKLLTPDDYQ